MDLLVLINTGSEEALIAVARHRPHFVMVMQLMPDMLGNDTITVCPH
jgi:hypothetical protein